MASPPPAVGAGDTGRDANHQSGGAREGGFLEETATPGFFREMPSVTSEQEAATGRARRLSKAGRNLQDSGPWRPRTHAVERSGEGDPHGRRGAGRSPARSRGQL